MGYYFSAGCLLGLVCVQWYYKIYEVARDGFVKGGAESIHGSLLTIGEMLQHTGSFLLPRYNDICKMIEDEKRWKLLEEETFYKYDGI